MNDYKNIKMLEIKLIRKISLVCFVLNEYCRQLTLAGLM